MGASSSSLFLAGTGLDVISGAAGAYTQSEALKAQGRAQSRTSRVNASLLDFQAQDAILRGGKESGRQLQRTRMTVGRQRAALAAQGVNLSVGGALEAQEEAHAVGALDALTIRNNAYRQAFGYQTEALNERLRGKIARISARGQARSTLLTGGLEAARKVASGAYQYKREFGGGKAPAVSPSGSPGKMPGMSSGMSRGGYP